MIFINKIQLFVFLDKYLDIEKEIRFFLRTKCIIIKMLLLKIIKEKKL